MRKPAVAAVITIATAIVVLELVLSARAHLLLGDFRAFYCAGHAIVQSADPYRASALYPCESAPAPFGLYAASAGVSVPAPQPGYALLFFAIFGAMPYLAAAALWFALLIAAFAWSCVLLGRLAGVPAAAGAAVLTIALATIVPYGELTTLVLAALLCMALALRRGAWTTATIAGAFAAIFPHVGVPALLAMFLLQPAMRLRLCILALVLAALDAAAGGPTVALAYFTRVLPAHTISEIGGTSQYGLTWALHALGVSDRVAVLAGDVSYAVMLVAGIAVAALLVRRFRDDAFLAVVPPAFAVFLGPFVHYTEIALALPAATLLAARATGALRFVAGVALVAIALPWMTALGQPFAIAIFALTAGAIVGYVIRADASAALRSALAAAVVCGALLLAGARLGPALPAHGPQATLDSSLAQASWAQFIGTTRTSTGAVWWIVKAPTWFGLLLLTLGCAYAGARKDQIAAVAVEHAPVRP